MLDRDGYRPNVAIVIVNGKNQVFWGKRIREHAWQFPQGGINSGETPERAMYRELREEVGLRSQHVKILGRTRDWLRYDVPQHWIKREWRGSYRGQKQIWYLLRLTGRDNDVSLRAHSRKGGGGAITDAANRQAENVRQHDRAQQDDERVGDGLVRRALVEDRRADEERITGVDCGAQQDQHPEQRKDQHHLRDPY